ncbi:MAG: 23S rRNA (guanosine(2251)-2'-O)-methyltransferase RlmB [Deltaproteobacteria bacterium RBG_16_54_11]|jgi:23S rRNA (guanosine2251-2'-O)-methyltransferase|nr:MAG: 23S rRNA (guanosine(2251)-2'-O)-methyltransferase RlmB [Deltaproteobacteria bacterium RBG_16_54_11]
MKHFWIYGINPVSEALRSNRCRIKEVWVAEGRGLTRLEGIVGMAESRGIPLIRVERSKLDSLTANAPHQGVVSFTDQFNYADLDEVLQRGADAPFLLVLDGIEDPRNLGALIRTADACGVWGVIIPKDRAAGITPVVAKSSAGAVFHMPVVRVANISSTLRKIKERDIWVVGAAADAQTDLYHQDLTIPVAVVIGGEGRGMRPLIKRECDLLVSIPMKRNANSLNASVAGSIILYEVIRQREHNSHP